MKKPRLNVSRIAQSPARRLAGANILLLSVLTK
jgi:hypothetical protein